MAQDLALEKAGRDAGFGVISVFAPPSPASASLFP
jgi:hypothetical protein